MRRRHGLTLAELLMALAITAIVGAGVVAMTDAVGTALESGRQERERTIASATAASRSARSSPEQLHARDHRGTDRALADNSRTEHSGHGTG